VNDCKRMEEYYEGYALGALEGADRAELESHLAGGCLECAHRVEEARWLVAQLAYLAPEAEPPAHLRARVLKAAQPRMLRPRLMTLGWLATAAAVLLLLFAGAQFVQLRREVSGLSADLAEQRLRQAELTHELERHQMALAVLSATETQEVRLAAGEGSRPEVRAFWNEQLGLVLKAQQVASLESDRTYQLWVVPKQGNPISAGIFRPDATGTVLYITTPSGRINEAAALAITDEPAGGRPQPTTTPIWVGKIS